MKKKLKNIAIIGNFWELVVCETILIMEGYDVPDEGWNKLIINDEFDGGLTVKMIACYGKIKAVCYHNHSNTNTINPFKRFKASQINEVVKYLNS